MAADDRSVSPGSRHRVVVAVAYPPMRGMITELLGRDNERWAATPAIVDDLARAIESRDPEVVIVDAGDFPRCCRVEFGAFPAGHVLVVGREPDPAYRHAALRSGAGGWVDADAVGDELSAQLQAVVAPISSHRGTS